MESLLGPPSNQHGAQEEDIDDLVPQGKGPTTAPTSAPSYKTKFLQSCLAANVLTLGKFKLKSGRESPYFFNSGLFHRRHLLYSIATAYAQTIIHHASQTPGFGFDILFGPAYKGIPLATATIMKLGDIDETNFGEISYSFNRKELKDHGEAGLIGGEALKGKRVVIIDDVITAGTAIKEAISIIKEQGGILVGIVIALDRMERMSDEGSGSAIGEVRREYGVPVLSIIDLNDLIGALGELGSEEEMLRVEEYKRRYGASD